MPNQFHRRLTEAELHRPERTGFGDPNLKTVVGTNKSSFTLPPVAATKISVDDLIFNPEDGQYYQDLNTGILYRYFKFGNIPLEGNQGTFLGKLSGSKAEGTEAETISVVDSDASQENAITIPRGQKISIQSIGNDIQVVRASETQTFITSSFTIKVNPFIYEFNAGTAYNNATDILSFNSDGVWENFVEFDRKTGRITNVLVKETSDAIGVIKEEFGGERKVVTQTDGAIIYEDIFTGQSFDTEQELDDYLEDLGVPIFERHRRKLVLFIDGIEEVTFLARDVSQIRAELYTEITEGEEITVYNPATGDAAKLTVNDNGDDEITSYGPGENVVVDVQDDKIRPIFPVGSLIYGEEGYRESSMKVDPSRIQLNVLGERVGDGIGALVNDIGVVTDKTTISLKNIDEITSIPDEQVLIILNKRGDVKKIVADGAQQLTVGTDTLTVQPFSIAEGDPVFEADTSVVKEPSYSSTGRITITENSITQAVSDINETSASVASLTLTVDANSASISSQASLIDNNSSAIASITSRVSTTETQIGTLNQSVTTIENTLEQNDVTAIAGLQTSVQGIEGDISTITARAVLTTDVNGNIATIDLESGVVGSAITIEANSVSINDIDFIQGSNGDPGEIRTSNYSAGSAGWKIDGNGDAEFNNVTVRSSNFSSLNSGFELTGSGIQLNEDVTLGSSNASASLRMVNPLIGTQSTNAGGSGSASAYFHNPFSTNAATFVRSNGYFFVHSDHETLDSNNNEVGTQFFFGFYTGGANPITQIIASGDGDFTFDVDGDIECTTLTETSDKYQKENIEPLGATLEKIVQLEGKTFDMLGASTKRKMGLLAQDVEPLFPEAVGVGHGENEEGERIEYKTLSYTQLIPALIESIKELNQKIDERSNTT